MTIIIEETHSTSEEKTIKTDFGIYELFKGNVWISKQVPQQVIQGTNIALLNPLSDELKVFAYVIRNGTKWGYSQKQFDSLDEIIESVFVSFGWSQGFIRDY